MRYVGLTLLIAAPSAFSLTMPTPVSHGLESSSIILLLSGVVGVFAIRRRE
jgi:hypothetical protein